VGLEASPPDGLSGSRQVSDGGPRPSEVFSQKCSIGCFTQYVFAGGGRPKNAAHISTVSRSWAGVIWAAFFRCCVEHYNKLCTGKTCIYHIRDMGVH
jgi:hypothetical protein